MSYAIDAFLLDGIEPNTKSPGVWLVRVKPYNQKLGHLLRSITLRQRKLTFDEANGWRELKTADAELLADLATLRQEPNNEQTPLALDVCTREEAKAVEDAEVKRRKAAKKASVDNAGALRSEHLPSTKASRRDRMIAARDLRDAERAGDIAFPSQRRSPDPKSVEEVDAEMERLEGLRSKLKQTERPREQRPREPQDTRGRERGAKREQQGPPPKPAARPQPPRRSNEDDDPSVAIGD